MHLLFNKPVLTHVELADEARDVAVLEVERQNFLGEATLVEHVETLPALENIEQHCSIECGVGRKPVGSGLCSFLS